jgi:Nif-specific regulatory protein
MPGPPWTVCPEDSPLESTYVRTELEHHLQRHENELSVLATVSQLMATETGQRQMLVQVLGKLEQELAMRRCTVMLLSPDGQELVVEAAHGSPTDESTKIRYQTGEGITGSVLKTGRAEIVPRISQEPRFRNRIHQRHPEESQEAGFLCVPIVLEGEVVGTLSADVRAQDERDLEEQARVLEIVASLIAFDVRARRLARVERQSLEDENRRLRDALEERFRPDNIIGNSRSMRAVYQSIHQVAASDTTVLIRGESGTGKELVASAIHYSSKRSSEPFVRVNCAALNESLLESELFGHEKGAFTGALFARVGRIEEAEGGTLFLDEIGDFSPTIQVKLLRVLQEREYERVGSNQTTKADVRILAATNKDLEEAVSSSEFRQDLYYRINVFPIVLPPLRERKDDILLLADYFVEKYSKKMKKPVSRISTPAINMMFSYHWPGNVRELENCIEHAVLLCTSGVIHGHNLPPTLQMPRQQELASTGKLQDSVALVERDMITDALKATRGNMAAAARQLGVTARIIRYKAKNLGIDCGQFSGRRN